MNARTQTFGYRVLVLTGPLLLLLIFQFFTFEPASARASGADLQFLPLPVVPEQDGSSFEQELAVRESSPFWYEEVELTLPTMPTLQQPDEPMIDPDPVFMLSAVLPSANKSFAVINGKPHSEGDVIEEGWTLVKISGQDRYVIIKHTSGRRLRVMMNR